LFAIGVQDADSQLVGSTFAGVEDVCTLAVALSASTRADPAIRSDVRTMSR
jgi:hypothetical protein